MNEPGVYVQTPPPHIHSGTSLAGRFWLKIAALLPALLTSSILGGPGFLKVLFLSVMSVTGFEWLSGGFRKKKTTLLTGEAFLTGILFAILLPESCPAALIVLGAFVATILISECFGGLGGRLFNAAIFGRIFLDLAFPGALGEPIIFRQAGNPWMLGAISICSVLFLTQKQIYLEAPVYFMAIFMAGAALFGGPGELLAAAGISLFSASFLMTDLVTLPLTRRGTNLFAIGSGLLAFSLCFYYPAVIAVGYTFLLMNCLTPWLNVWTRPTARRAMA